jgi:glycosyltransferase involved in cell wall biosynthesis
MKFSIITPTYKRKELLKKAVASLQAQTYKDWEMVIVNDSPRDEAYLDFASSINDHRIHYYVNNTNRGVNYSRNFALEKLSADSRWVIFLDDDDYLSPDALQTFRNLILLHGEQKWFVTNRAYANGRSITKFPKDNKHYSYSLSYLIFKRIRGDATHCIETKLLTQKKIKFSRYVKQGEEWFFFYQLGLYADIYYSDHNSTISGGYDTTSGLNFRKRGMLEQIKVLSILFFEGFSKELLYHPSFIFYVCIRLVRACIPR